MTNRQQIQEIPGALRLALEKARVEFAPAVRKVRWSEGPLYVCGAGKSAGLGIAAGSAFEAFLGWPVVAHSAAVFQNYSLELFHPRSVLLVVEGKGEWQEAEDLVHVVHERRGTVMALAHNPEGALAKLADHVFVCHAAGDAESPAEGVCLHAALNFLAFEIMRVLKKPKPHWAAIESEFDQLPQKIDWVFTQLPGAVRSVAAEIGGFPRLNVVGGGFYQYPAWHGAWRMRALSNPQVMAVEAADFLNAHAGYARRGDGVLLLSGSQFKLKKLMSRCAAHARGQGARVLSLTDANDREVAEGSDLGLLLPSLLEVTSSSLMMFMLEWLAAEVARKA